VIRTLRILGAIIVVLGTTPIATAQETRPALRWTDGMFEYDAIAPTAGWFVPIVAIARERPGLDQIMAQSTRMSADELRAYATGAGGRKVTKDLLLLAYEVTGPTVFLWKGKRSSGQQQIFPMAWSGETWDHPGWSSGNADAFEMLFGPKGSERRTEHVLVMTQSGLDPNTLQTEFVRAGPFPGIEAILRAGIERADDVVYLRPTIDRIKDQALDCLKGSLSAKDLPPLVSNRWEYQTLLFLRREGTARRLWFAYHSGGFHNELGDLHVEEYAQESPFLKHARWALATNVTGTASRPTATVTWTSRGRTEDGWMRVELAAGRDEPASIYKRPITRSGKDRGEATFAIRIRRGGHEATVAPRGRFGAESFAAAEPEQLPALGCEYRFVNCGVGVIKIEIRPKSRPWSAEIQATYDDPNPWDAPSAPVSTGVLVLTDG
jgi:hypothetical protein